MIRIDEFILAYELDHFQWVSPEQICERIAGKFGDISISLVYSYLHILEQKGLVEWRNKKVNAFKGIGKGSCDREYHLKSARRLKF